MPTGEHETPIALAKVDPALLTWLLTNVFGMKVPDYHHARAHPTDVRVLVPATYHADGMLLYCDGDDRPMLAVVLEVQRGWDRGKRWTWKLYVAQLESELLINVALLVYCPDPMIARRYRDMVDEDGVSLLLRPLIFTPDDVPLITDVDLARDQPALAVFAAICHGAGPGVDGAFPALAEALRTLQPRSAALYYDILLAGLPQASRTRWEAYMSTTVGYEFRSELLREAAAQGKAEGEGRAVLTVLDARGVPVAEHVRNQILACTDLAQLDTWLRRALTASTADEVVGP